MPLINFVLIRLDTQHLKVNRQDNYTPLLKYWLIACMEQNGPAERHRVETGFYFREISAEFLMRKIYRLLLLCLLTLISACQPFIENRSTQPASNTVQPYPPATLQVLSTTVRIDNPTNIPTQDLTAAPPAATAGTPDMAALLKEFPLNKGTSWTWNNTGYAQANNDPSKIIHGTSRIVETVADTLISPPFFVAHIQGSKTMLSADPGWQENGTFGLGNYDYWYILRDGQVYLSYTRPDPTKFQADQLLLEYQFPMYMGASWCPDKRTDKSPATLAETPFPCEYAGMRAIENVEYVQTPAGRFEHCYRMTDFYNSGGVRQ
jgi:hypothetical protein